MNFEDGSFIEYFCIAQHCALTPRQSSIVDLRFGLTNGEPQTLAKVGQEYGVTRERIRQIVNRSISKLIYKGKKEINKGKVNEPCAELLLYLQNLVRPNDEGEIERFVQFIETELSFLPERYSFSLAAYLVFQTKSEVERILPKARQLFRLHKDVKKEEFKQQVLSEKLLRLLDKTKWPASSKPPLDIPDYCTLERKRNVSLDGKGNAGSFYSDKMHRLVEFESELEYDFLLWLEHVNDVSYYQEQPLEIPYIYEGKSYLYYPDILVILRDRRIFVVEIKPVFEMALHTNLVKWAMLKNFCIENGLGLLVTDGNYSIQQLVDHEVNLSYSNAVIKQISQNGQLSWQEYRKIRDEYTPSRKDFVALVLQNKLIWRLSPFLLSSPIKKSNR